MQDESRYLQAKIYDTSLSYRQEAIITFHKKNI